MDPRRGTTQFDLDAPLYQIGNQPLTWATRRDTPVLIAGGMVERYVTRMGVEDRDEFGFGIPICNLANHKPM